MSSDRSASGPDHVGDWVVEVLWAEGVAALRWVTATGDCFIEPAIGTRLAYDAGPLVSRRCVGGYRYEAAGATFEPCVHHPVPGRRQCEPCERRDNIHAASFHQSHQRTLDTVRAELRPRLERPHVLYLAAFRDGSLKVGTSVASRSDTRLIEQGAWRALIIAQAVDGLVVRHLEDEVTRVDGISQTVHASRKVTGHAQPRPDEALEAMLDEAAERTLHTVLGWEDHGIVPTSTPWTNPTADDSAWGKTVAHPGEVDQGKHGFTVTHVCGKIALASLVSMPDERVVIDLSRVCGIPMADPQIEPDPVALQTSLF